tara:strand:- start:98 stop:322 length:225 start_codon:yes stop_codon:yes gene_type:complete
MDEQANRKYNYLMNLLNSIGSLFVYRSPSPLSGERLKKFVLMGKTNRELRKLVPTTSHYSKKVLVEKILKKKPL